MNKVDTLVTKETENMNTEYNFKEIIPKYDAILERGLCKGVGKPDGQMCIEAAICTALGLPFGDDPVCVASAVRAYKIAINDKIWSSPQARAKALRDIGIAQIGSKDIVNDEEFICRLSQKTIQVLIVHLFRNNKYTKNNLKLQELTNICEKEPTDINCRKLAAATDAAATAYATAAATAAAAAADAATAAAAADAYLIMSVNLALEVLKELKSPGCEWI